MRVVLDDEGASALVGLDLVDAMLPEQATRVLRECCPSRRWLSEVVAGRPYGAMRSLIAASEDVLADLSWFDVSEALVACSSGQAGAVAAADLRRSLAAAGAAERGRARERLRETVRLRLITTLR